MAIVPLFKNHHGYVNVVTNLTTYPFVGGRYFTEDEEKIADLTRLAKKGEHGLYIDPAEPEVDTEAATPMDALKKKIIQEFLAQQGEVKDVGTYGAKNHLGSSISNTASSAVMGNSLAAKEQHAQQQGETILVNKEAQVVVAEEVVKVPQETQTTVSEGQQAALDKLKSLGKS